MSGSSGVGLATPREGIDYLGGFGLVHDDSTNPRIMKWDSAA